MNRVSLAVLSVFQAFLVAQTTTWTSFADRRGHAMARSHLGEVLVFGGQRTEANGGILGDTYRLSPGSTSWSREAAGPQGRARHAMAAVQVSGGTRYVVYGGIDASGAPTDTVWLYDGIGWVTGPVGPSARSGHAMVTHLGTQTILMFGGFDGSVALDDLWELNPGGGKWQPRASQGPRPSARSEHCMAYSQSGQKVFLFGGAPGLADLWEYDLGADSWQPKTPAGSRGLPRARSGAAMGCLHGIGGLVLFGGLSAQSSTTAAVLDDTWYYSVAGNAWSPLPNGPRPQARYRHAVSVDATGNSLLLVGGTDLSGGVLDGVWSWSRFTGQWSLPQPTPAARVGVAMAYDSSRACHLVFGGRDVATGADLDETWEVDGVTWRRPASTARPSPRSDAGLVFDPLRNRAVLYGGRTQAGAALGDTWEWDGAGWVLRSPPSSPPAAAGIQPVFDSRRGITCALIDRDMWAYDGAAWTRVIGPRPSPRDSFACSYDTQRERLVVFGGGLVSTRSPETWEWDGSGWSLRAGGAGSPSARNAHAMVYDPIRQVHIMVGGWDGSSRLGDTYSWNGSVWTRLAASVGARSSLAMVFDGVTARPMIVGGYWPVAQYTTETLGWTGSSWVPATGTALAAGRHWSAMAFDPDRQRVVLFGGGAGDARNQVWTLDDTWEFDGRNWSQRSPVHAPAPRGGHRLVFDPRTREVLLYGGGRATGEPVFNDTWTWNGADWTQRNPPNNPGYRYDFGLVSTGRRTLLFFGGFGGYKDNEMWEWTGSDWVPVESADAPPARTNYGAAYDVRRDRVVVFGGMSSNDRDTAVYWNDTWEWDGDSWAQRLPSTAPSPRGWCRLAYDAARARSVLFGGADKVSTFADTWEWDGSSLDAVWTGVAPLSNPPGSCSHDLSFDGRRRLTVAFGRAGLWEYGASRLPGAAVNLRPMPRSGPWPGPTLEMEFDPQAAGIGVFVCAISSNGAPGLVPCDLAPVDSPGCHLLVAEDRADLIVPGTRRYVSFALPNSTAFLGMVLHGQAGYFDGPSGNVLAIGNGVRMTIGQK